MEETTLASQENRSLVDRLTPTQVKADADLILQAMQKTMKEGQDYGVIPGTNKPSLYKPGAEKVMMLFRLGGEPTIHDLSTSDEIRYRIITRIFHAPTGTIVGYGVGEASTSEDKYRWRKTVCDAEFDEVAEDRKRIKWSNAKTGPYSTKQVRTNPADLANTVLKMADKRSMISGVLKATAASAIFSQDMEDLADEIRESVANADEGTVPPIQEPQPAKASQPSPQAQPAAQKPPSQGSKPLPATYRAMASKIEGKCGECEKAMPKDTPIYYDPEGRRAYHQHHFA